MYIDRNALNVTVQGVTEEDNSVDVVKMILIAATAVQEMSEARYDFSKILLQFSIFEEFI